MNTGTEIIQRSDSPLSVQDLRTRITRVHEVMKGVMKKDVHFGKIPGTQKASLWKSGAELLLTTFRIASSPEVTDLSGPDEVRYRVRCVATSQVSGEVLGAGIGECSSNEEKYKWRSATCTEEYEELPDELRRGKWVRGNDKPYQKFQVRTQPSDVANTILKMAKKRAMIDMTLSVLGCSDIFEQDIDDRDEIVERERAAARARGGATTASQGADQGTGEVQKKQGGSGRATAAQIGLIARTADGKGVSEQEVLRKFEIGDLTELPFDKVDVVLQWLRGLQ